MGFPFRYSENNFEGFFTCKNSLKTAVFLTSISALYFKIYALYFSQQAMCVFSCPFTNGKTSGIMRIFRHADYGMKRLASFVIRSFFD